MQIAFSSSGDSHDLGQRMSCKYRDTPLVTLANDTAILSFAGASGQHQLTSRALASGLTSVQVIAAPTPRNAPQIASSGQFTTAGP